MRKKTVAVCLSGQSRSWKVALPSITTYFSSNDLDVRFFGHTWDQNHWKMVDDGKRTTLVEELNAAELHRQLSASMHLTALQVDEQVQCVVDGRWYTWLPMLKSTMYANHLKCLYEAEHGIFDIVVRTRWDVAFNPSQRFDRFVHNINPTVLYGIQQHHFADEFWFPAFDDIMYFGSSRVMDIIDGFYHAYRHGEYERRAGYDSLNIAPMIIGCGTMLQKWASLHNIQVITPHDFKIPTLVRKEASNLVWPKEYSEIVEIFTHHSSKFLGAQM